MRTDSDPVTLTVVLTLKQKDTYLDADSSELLHDVRFALFLRTSIIVIFSLKVI